MTEMSLGRIAADIASGAIRIVDLTHTLDQDFPVIAIPPEFGQCARFRLEEVSRYDERGPAWYWHNFTCNEHTGTHFDAPIHWVSGKDLPNNTVDTIPPENFIASACVIDCSSEVADSPDFELKVDFVKVWEAKHGEIPPISWVLMRTDWWKRKGAEYINLRPDGAHSPGPTPEVIRFLVDERDILGFGTETVGTDAGQGAHFLPPYPAHFYLHGKGKYGLQCLANLDKLPPTGSLVFAAPLKIKNGSGSPLRVLALVPGNKA
jgi:kynurenine formamidase